MNKITLLLISCLSLLAQTSNNLVTIIPTTNSSGVPTATGLVQYRDLGTTTPHYIRFRAAASMPADLTFVYPSVNSGGCFNVTSSSSGTPNVISIGGCGTGLPASDGGPLFYSAADSTKRLFLNLGGFTTATDNVLAIQNSSYTAAGIDIPQTFSNTQNYSGQINLNGSIFVRASDRTIWSPGDVNGDWTWSGDNLWSIGSSAKRTKLIEAIKLTTRSTASSSLQYCDHFAGGVDCTEQSDVQALKITNGATSHGCEVDGEKVRCTSLAGLVTNAYMDATGNFFSTIFVGTGIRSICTSAGGILIVSGCAGGAPFSDSSAIIKNAGDPTKTITVSAASISPGTNRTLTAQDSNYILAGINIPQTFSAAQTYTSSIELNGANVVNMNGSLFLRASDRTIWSPGDINGNVTVSTDNFFDIGTTSKRWKSIQAVLVNSNNITTGAFAASTGLNVCGITGNGITCSSVGGLVTEFSTTTSGGNAYIAGGLEIAGSTSLKMSGLSGFGTLRTVCLDTSNLLSVTGCPSPGANAISAASAGKKQVGGQNNMGSFSCGSVAGRCNISTGLSSIDYFSAIPITGGATCGSFSASGCEIYTTASPSGGSITLFSSNTGSGGFFFWMATGNP